MTDSSEARAQAQAQVAVDAIIARTGLPVTPEDYARLLSLYPAFQSQAAALRLPELPDLEPAHIYHA